jgi:hypothetical protein
MTLQATVAVLRQILLELGFTMHVQASDHDRFDHRESGTWFDFRNHKDEEAVNVSHLVVVRRILDEKRLLARDQFEERLRSRLIAG